MKRLPRRRRHRVRKANLAPGHATLPSSCPVCEHSPLSADDCKPHKSLRTTIKVFLRTEEKKRESSRPKESKDSVPPTPVEPVAAAKPTALQSPVVETSKDNPPAGAGAPEAPFTVEGPEKKPDEAAPTAQDGAVQEPPKVRPLPEVTDGCAAVLTDPPQELEQAQLPPADDTAPATVAGDANVTDAQTAPEATESGIAPKADGTQPPAVGTNFGVDSTNGNFSGTPYNGDMNQMQMMMAMQNGMMPNNFSGFPMMSTFGDVSAPCLLQNR